MYIVGLTIFTELNSNSPFNNEKNFGDISNSSLLKRFSPSLDTKLISLTDNLSPDKKKDLYLQQSLKYYLFYYKINFLSFLYNY